MKKIPLIACLLASGIAWLSIAPAVEAQDEDPVFTEEFFFEKCNLKHRGVNDYFIPLKPGCWQYLEGEEVTDEGDIVLVALAVDVLAETRVVDGTRCATIRETHWEDGELVEISWNYFAICKTCKDVVYFGEEVDIIEDGVVVSHDGAWLAGIDGAKPGIIMPGCPLIGSRYFQEVAPGIAEDRAEHLDNTATVETPAGIFENCLTVYETTPVDPDEESFKAYACGVGLIFDDGVGLVDYGCGGRDDNSSDDKSSDDDSSDNSRRR